MIFQSYWRKLKYPKIWNSIYIEFTERVTLIVCRKIYESPIDEGYENVINELNGILETSKELQKKGFIIGFEMQKDLDPLIDRAVKRILSTCTDLLIFNREMNKMVKWHDIQQQNLLPKSELISFVEENRPAAASTFIGKYCEMSSSYYSSCAKGFFETIKRREKKTKKVQPVLIGDPIEGDDIKSRRRSSFGSFFTSTNTNDLKSAKESSFSSSSSSSTSLGPLEEIGQQKFEGIPFETANLLIELLKRECSFFKQFFGSSYVRRKSLLTKIFSKCFSIIKTNLKEIVHENCNALESLKMMSEVTTLEVQVVSLSDLSTPTQWLNEIQNFLFEDFKRLLRKQFESLSNYSELKTCLSSGEVRHHFVVKRFANFMKSSLEIMKTFQRPWEIIQVELKKLEHYFYNWMSKICGYLKDRREAFLFQINNFDLVIETCFSVAGADFMASLQFKFDPCVDKFIKLEQEKYFYDLITVIKSTSSSETNKINRSTFSSINSKIMESFKAILETFKSSTFTDFSNFAVSELLRQKFADETIGLYKKYLEVYNEKFGGIEEGIEPIELNIIENLISESMKWAIFGIKINKKKRKVYNPDKRSKYSLPLFDVEWKSLDS